MIDADAIDAACAVLAPPPVARSVYEFAGTITLSGGGPLDGTKLNPKAEIAIDLWLQMLASRRYQWHVLIAPSQRGKTLCGVIVPTLHALIERRVNAGWVMPNLDKLAQKWTGDIQPTIESSGFGVYLPTKGPSSRGGRPAALRISDPESGARMATMYAMALGKGGSESSTASNPCVWLTVDEADDAENAGQLKLAMKRTAAFGAMGGGVVTSTINERRGRDLHPMLELYEDTTKSRLGHLCPHCGSRVIPGIEHFNVEKAALACPSCGVLWSENDRHTARNAGEYVHANPDAEVFGILYTAVDYFWEYADPATGKITSVMQQLATEHRSALAAKERGDPSPWSTYLRKQWCMAEAAGDDEVPATPALEHAARSMHSPHKRGTIPDGCTVSTVGMDTGKRSAWMLSLAMKPDLSWYVTDFSRRLVTGTETDDGRREPTSIEQCAMYDALLNRAGDVGRANALGVDVGYNTDVVVPWARRNGIRLVRGDDRPHGRKDDDSNRMLPSWAEDRQQDDGSHWLFIDGAIVKTEIAKALARDPGVPGAGHLPHGTAANDWLIQHLTAEVWRGEWVPVRKENHLLDCLVYAWALAMLQMNRPKAPKRKYGVVSTL